MAIKKLGMFQDEKQSPGNQDSVRMNCLGQTEFEEKLSQNKLLCIRFTDSQITVVSLLNRY